MYSTGQSKTTCGGSPYQISAADADDIVKKVLITV